MRMALNAKLEEAEHDDVFADFAGALDRVSASDREFQAAQSELVPTYEVLVKTRALIPALRSYLVRQLSGVRCAAPGKSTQEFSVAALNAYFARLDPEAQTLKPVTPEEIRPVKFDESRDQEFSWQSQRSRQVMDALRWLNHGNRNLPDSSRFWTETERATDAWNARYLELVKLMEGWQEREEPSDADYLFMMSQTYSTLARLVPPGPARDSNLEAAIRKPAIGTRSLPKWPAPFHESEAFSTAWWEAAIPSLRRTPGCT